MLSAIIILWFLQQTIKIIFKKEMLKIYCKIIKLRITKACIKICTAKSQKQQMKNQIVTFRDMTVFVSLKFLKMIKQRTCLWICLSVCLCSNSCLNGKFYWYQIWYGGTPGIQQEHFEKIFSKIDLDFLKLKF